MKLAVGDDLNPIHELFRRVRYHFPQHMGEIKKLQVAVNRHIAEYHNCVWRYTRTGKQGALDAAQRELDSITVLLSVVEKQELMSLLSGKNLR